MAHGIYFTVKGEPLMYYNAKTCHIPLPTYSITTNILYGNYVCIFKYTIPERNSLAEKWPPQDHYSRRKNV